MLLASHSLTFNQDPGTSQQPIKPCQRALFPYTVTVLYHTTNKREREQIKTKSLAYITIIYFTHGMTLSDLIQPKVYFAVVKQIMVKPKV